MEPERTIWMNRPPIVEAIRFGKTFAGRTVLKGVDLAVHPGEIHALVGQNGSGKSTFIKILAGYHAPDPGALLAVRGQTVDLPLQPDAPARLGLSFVHQDLGLFEDGSVLENLMVGHYQTGRGWRISWARELSRSREILEGFGLAIDPRSRVGQLTEVQRAILAIARALSRLDPGGGALLVLDEPTARLPRESVDTFFDAVRGVAARGIGVLFVSHRLDEVLGLTDRVTVLRDGVVAATRETPDLTVSSLVELILGFSLEQLYPGSTRSGAGVVLQIRDLAGATVDGFSANIHSGEILGLTGLIGMGHDLVPQLVFGSVPARSGTLDIGGQVIDATTTNPRRSMDAGLALLPANRQRDGGVAEATVAENMTLATLPSYFRGGTLRHRYEAEAVGGLLDQFDVRPRSPELRFGALSGGNQQKCLVAKWLATRPAVLFLEEPTHGVDVGAKKQILQNLHDAAANGAAVVVSSVEAEDLAQLCHRVLVFRHGRVARELRGSELTAARITEQSLIDRPGGETTAEESGWSPFRA